MTHAQEQMLASLACGSDEQIIAMIRGRREDARHLPEFERTENRMRFAPERACKLAELDRSTFQYDGDDGAVRERLRAFAAMRRRFCYRRPGTPLGRKCPDPVSRHRRQFLRA